MDEQRINELAKKWQDGTLTVREREEIEHWYASFDDSGSDIVSGEDQEALGRRMYTVISREKARDLRRRRSILWLKRVAAVLIPLIIVTIPFIRDNSGWFSTRQTVQKTTERFKNDVLPGQDYASLELSDGSTVILDGDKRGLLAEQAGTRIVLEDNRLSYEKDESGKGEKSPKKLVYNTIRTPQGGQYQLVLPDGSTAWLNAESSIRFPASFPDTAREVTITGEVYFDISHDNARPFRAKAGNGIAVQVLGTEFNIAAYENEAFIKTTLVEGSVKLFSDRQQSVLKPGQQAGLNWSGGPIKVYEVDIEAAIAWKSGYFNFENAAIEEIMRQLSRWYDIEVLYRGTVQDKFNVLMWPRDQPISRLLELLELTGRVKFEIDGKKVTVGP